MYISRCLNTCRCRMLGHPVKDPSQSFHSVRAQPAELERHQDIRIWLCRRVTFFVDVPRGYALSCARRSSSRLEGGDRKPHQSCWQAFCKICEFSYAFICFICFKIIHRCLSTAVVSVADAEIVIDFSRQGGHLIVVQLLHRFQELLH